VIIQRNLSMVSSPLLDCILNESRAIAGLSGSESVTAKHLADAVQRRSPERNSWICELAGTM
jgi:predicted ATPase with chaperone activity